MDLDGDGYLDILSGSYSRQSRDMAGLFQILYGTAKGGWKKAQVLKGTDDKPLIIPVPNQDQWPESICTRPTAVDWDGDGDLDLIVGNFTGTFYWFKAVGKGKFDPKPVQIQAGKKALRIPGVHSDPFVIDWDGDGDLDLLSGSSNGGAYLSENVAKPGKAPKMTAFRALIKPGKQIAYGSILREKDLKGPTRCTRVWADDVNGDGKLDLLLGDCVSLLEPAKGLTVAEYNKRRVEWQKKLIELSKGLRGKDEAKRRAAMQEYSKHSMKRKEFVKEERTGFIWLYVQK